MAEGATATPSITHVSHVHARRVTCLQRHIPQVCSAEAQNALMDRAETVGSKLPTRRKCPAAS
ncbi:MAG: hypothetical protein JWN48_2388, partial [Myxococcaceae bacterium]|nr:hypothetical protein [Myxococcaceae bacterium]